MKMKKLFALGAMVLSCMTAFGQSAASYSQVFQTRMDNQGRMTQVTVPVLQSQGTAVEKQLAAQQKAVEQSLPMTKDVVNGIAISRHMTPAEAEQYKLRVQRRASDNEIFTAYTVENQVMTFKVLDETAKTCQVGVGEGNSAGYDDCCTERNYDGVLTIPSEAKGYKVVAIGNGAFWDCKFSAINIPNTVTSLNYHCFTNCPNITSLSIPASVEELDTWTVDYCTALETITVDAASATFKDGGVNAIIKIADNRLYVGCKTTVIPDYVTAIGGGAFSSCTGLTAIHIPASVTYIGPQSFQGCTGVTSVTVDAANTSYNSNGGCNAIISSSNNLLFGCRNTVIPETVTSIGYAAFNGQPIKKVTLPKGVTNVGGIAFAWCEELTEIISKATTPPQAQEYAFSGDYDRATLFVPKDTKPDYKAAVEWSKFTNIIELDDSGNPIVDETEFTALTAEGVEMKFKVLDKTAKTCQVGWHEGYGSWNSNNASINTATTGTVTIPSEAKGYKVVKIAGAAFYGCSSITMVTIPNTVEEIDWFAFSFTSAMTSLNIPASVTTIGNRALAHPNGRTTLTVDAANPIYKSENNGIIEKATNKLVAGCATTVIPSTVTALDDAAFYGCSDAKSFLIPASVEAIGSQAFSYCYNLERLTVASGNATFDSREDCGAIIETATNTLLKGAGNMFIPATVTAIAENAVEGNNLLKVVEIPASVTSIKNYAFYYCSNMYQVISHIQDPFEIDKSAICRSYETYPEYLYVPAGTKDKYMATASWNLFRNIEELGSETTVELDPLPENTTSFSTTLPGAGSLTGTTVDNILFTLKSSNGDGYDETKGCVSVKTTMSDADVDALDLSQVGTPAFTAMFTGMVFAVQAGRGSITIDLQSLGGYSLGVKIGGGAVVKIEHADRNTAIINYNVAEDTYVLLYARNPDGSAPALRAAAEEESYGLDIYSIAWNHTGDYDPDYDPTGISTVNTKEETVTAVYSLDGRRLSEPAKGVVIIRNNQGESKKVMVK